MPGVLYARASGKIFYIHKTKMLLFGTQRRYNGNKDKSILMSFFLWYYTAGLFGVLRASGNLVRYVFHHFNIWGLTRTLFVPWKRDISFRLWRGFHPLLFLHSLSNNMLVSFLGAVVRSGVIVAGLALVVLALVGAGTLLVLWFFTPLILIGGAFALGMIWGPLWGGGAFLLALATVGAALGAWRDSVRRQTDFSHDLTHAPWRDRTFLRLGITPKNIPEEVFRSSETRIRFLADFSLDEEDFVRAAALEEKRYFEQEQTKRFWDWEMLHRSPRIGKHWVYAYTPLLDRYSEDLAEKDYSEYRHQRPIGRGSVMEMLALDLSRPAQNNVLLVGNPGIGKRSLVHALAKAIRENEYQGAPLDDVRMMLFNLGQVLADGRAQDLDPKNLLRQVLDQAVYAGNVVLVIEDMELYLNPDSELSVGEVLHEYLTVPTCRMIGLTTTESFRTLGLEQIPALKYFEVIQVPEPSKEDTIAILLDIFKVLELKRPVFTLQSLEAIVDSAERYNWEMPFPERAIDLAQEVLVYWEKQPDLPFITRAVVEDFLEEKSGIPMGETTNEERDKLLHLEELLHERVIGQDEAIKQIAEAFRKARAGLGNDTKPIGSFLFLGPTGVGKTETAKALAAVYFGDEERMVRLDMSEFQSPQSVAELIGSAELDVQGRLTSLIKEHPYSILLLDELEKAYPRVLDIFLQILDEGFVTDGFGHKVNFRNTIIIATSNAGAQYIHEATLGGQAIGDIEESLMERVIADGLFRPEFLNRFDGVILFQTLTSEEMAAITKLKLEAFAKKLYEEKKITLTFAPEVIPLIIERGYKPEFGARSINRYIADVVEDALVKKILRGDIRDHAQVTFGTTDLGE